MWEKKAGYCRAKRVHDTIYVSGTTATHGSISIGCGPGVREEADDDDSEQDSVMDDVEIDDDGASSPLSGEDKGDSGAEDGQEREEDPEWLEEIRAEAQLDFIVDKISGALKSLGGSLEDVVRTRVYVEKESLVEVVARAHGRAFGGIAPANTLVVAGIVGDGLLVEMEAEARLDAEAAARPPAAFDEKW